MKLDRYKCDICGGEMDGQYILGIKTDINLELVSPTDQAAHICIACACAIHDYIKDQGPMACLKPAEWEK